MKRFASLLLMKLRSYGRSKRSIFDDVYMNHRWGSNANLEASSGKGSLPANSTEYEQFVVDYIKRHNIVSIVDIGCGDFQVSQRILTVLNDERITYLGTDVSQVIIDRNKIAFESDNIKFQQLDAGREDLPAAELITVREVLQHLPNKDVERILSKLVAHHSDAHILVTNTVATSPDKINVDIPAGTASRAGIGSGLWIDKPPFNFNVEEVYRRSHRHHDTIIITARLLGYQ